MQQTHCLEPAEQDQLARLGYLVRERVFDARELDAILGDCEALVKRVTGPGRVSQKFPVGSYLFQMSPDLCTMVKWEPEHPDVVQAVEPCAHLDEGLERLGADARLVAPMCDLLGVPEVALFTEKLNLKRATVGGRYVVHQDYPYWVESAEDPAQVATALICLDDSTRESGCLEVLPGSHLGGVRPGRKVRGFGRFEMDTEGFDDAQLRIARGARGQRRLLRLAARAPLDPEPLRRRPPRAPLQLPARRPRPLPPRPRKNAGRLERRALGRGLA